jgi:hypothetical protein
VPPLRGADHADGHPEECTEQPAAQRERSVGDLRPLTCALHVLSPNKLVPDMLGPNKLGPNKLGPNKLHCPNGVSNL